MTAALVFEACHDADLKIGQHGAWLRQYESGCTHYTGKKNVNVDAVILESHKNWVDNSPLRSLEVSAQFLNARI